MSMEKDERYDMVIELDRIKKRAEELRRLADNLESLIVIFEENFLNIKR